MIDKSIRQHYQTGEKVKKFGYDVGQKLISSAFPTKDGKLDVGQLAKNVATNKLTTAATKKLAGTGILSSLGPIGMLIAYMLAKKGMKYASGKMPKDIGQAFTQGFTGLGVASPEEQKELRVLENRRAKMLQRKNEGRNYSERNLDIVTRAIAEAKGLDINNPNEMKNIDKPITQIQIEKRITEAPRVIPKTPEIISPHLLGGDEIITPRVIPKTPEVISPHLEGDRTIPTPTSTLTTDFAFEDVKRAAQEKEEQDRIVAAQVQQAAAIKAENDRQQRERDAAAARAPISVPVPAHISGGGGNGGQSGSMPTGTGGRNPWGRAKGGRVDKALGGRVRDI